MSSSFGSFVGMALGVLTLTGFASFAENGLQPKFCGDPTLIENEPCLPPNWCEGPQGPFPARQDGTCRPEDMINHPTHRPPPSEPHAPEFRCTDGYEPVMLRDGRLACAGDLRSPE